MSISAVTCGCGSASRESSVMRYRQLGPHSPRRGVTLVEMLVAVTLLVLMMTVIVTIFTSATSALSGVQTFQQLDGDLRQLDTTIRRDLGGITARLTPPLNPNEQRGYLEYGENAFADLQMEDTDDYIRFTAKAPEGQPFTGRVWLGSYVDSPSQPVLITSEYAEIIYFLRNGNLYRRVFLIAPERQAAVNTAWVNAGGNPTNPVGGFAATFNPAILRGLKVSWQGVNDLSARPAATGSIATSSKYAAYPIQLNTLGDLTNRENRAFSPRFANDYVNNTTGVVGADGIPDDQNTLNTDGSGGIAGDSIPDYYPTLYPGMPTSLLNDPTPANRFAASNETLAFPFIYPGAYSRPDAFNGALAGLGWIHSTDPDPTTAFASYIDQLQRINHSPIETGGDSLALPDATTTKAQTWWGFPTWRETMLTRWNDPSIQVLTGAQPFGLHPFAANVIPSGGVNNARMLENFLPPMTAVYRDIPQPFNDTLGNALPVASATDTSQALWQGSWDDDLIMTGVRSFDIKIFDNSYPGYVDLGWGDDLRLYPDSIRPVTPPFLSATPNTSTWTSGTWYTLSQTFAHEGRMPPLDTDNRVDAQFGTGNVGTPTTPAPGDPNKNSVMRLRRVWDTWSTDYTNAPARGIHPTTKLPIGPPDSLPVYPSYPAPYPAPMRGIQIQIRVADPRNEQVKSLTIRQDFSDKL